MMIKKEMPKSLKIIIKIAVRWTTLLKGPIELIMMFISAFILTAIYMTFLILCFLLATIYFIIMTVFFSAGFGMIDKEKDRFDIAKLVATKLKKSKLYKWSHSPSK